MGRARGHAVPGTRLRAPEASGFIRPRLHTLLAELDSRRLGLVVAPAGSGKTTLLARWVSERPGPVAWYRADSADATGPGIVPRLVDALGTALAGRVDLPRVDARSPEALAALAEQVGERVLLVIDDLHELSGTAAMTDLERLLLLAPPNLVLLLSTRTMPPINMARSELAQPLVVIADDLRFRSWEVEGLFRDFYGEPLRPDDAAALARRTDGWAAALQLFHLATTGRGPLERTRAVRSLSGRARYAQDYLSTQVLAGLPESLGELLRKTCVFDVLTGARCDALLDTEGSQFGLEELTRRQALTSSEDNGETFRYHEVLRRHLETSLYEELGGARMRAWYSRAADILEAEGAMVEALRARCRGGDWVGVQRLLQEDGKRLADDRINDWAELLPSWLAQGDPWVGLAEARRLLDDGQFAAAQRAARAAGEQFRDAVGKALCRDVTRTAATWLTGPQRVDPRWADVLRAALQRDPLGQLEPARALGPPFGDLVEGVIHGVAGDVHSAMAPLSRAGGSDEPRVALSARLLASAVASWTDHYTCDQHELDMICLETERYGLTWLNRIARAVALAFTGGARDLEQARAIAADCHEREDAWGALLIEIYLSTLLQRRDQVDLDLYEGAIDVCHALGIGALEAWGRCWHALALADEAHPDAERDARAAEALARAAAIPGVLPIAYAALARIRSDDRAELHELAESSARQSGLDCRPWLWSGRNQEPATAPGADAAAPEPRIELTCFGAFRLVIGGVAPDLDGVRPRARTLLRLLAVHAGQPVHRERLVDALWPDLDPGAATHNLQVAISTLRRALQPVRGESLIARHGEAYLLSAGESALVDVREFEAAITAATQAKAGGDGESAVAAFGRALRCYTGDLLVEDGAAEWVLETRERYRVLAAEAAAALAALEFERGDAAAAAAAANRGIQIDRCHDASWRELIRAHRHRGDLAAAQRAEQAYHEVLASLGVPVTTAR